MPFDTDKPMPNLIERVKHAYKAFWGSGNWIDSNHSAYGTSRFTFAPNTNIDYARLVGPLWANSAVQACLNKLVMAWPESYPCVKEQQEKKKVVEVEGHPLATLLSNPNSAYDDTVLWAATIFALWPKGNAYWGINRNGLGEIGEFVFLPNHCIKPMRKPRSKNPGPDYYEYTVDGTMVPVKPADVVHYRFGVDPTNDLLGIGLWASVDTNVFTDNEATNYVNSALKNKGAAWLIASPKSPEGYFNDPVAVKDKIEAHTTGDNRHRALVMDGATDIVFPPSVKDTGPDELRRTPEARICALAGLPPMWVGLSAGLERSTFSNMEEADKVAWQTIVAVQRMLGRQLTMQVLRRPGNFGEDWQEDKYFAGFDYSEVRALQPNKVEEWKRAGEAHYVHKILTKDEARAEIGYDPLTPEQAKELEDPEPVVAQPTKPSRSKSDLDELREKIAVEASAREQEFRKLFGENLAEDEEERLLAARNGAH